MGSRRPFGPRKVRLPRLGVYADGNHSRRDPDLGSPRIIEELGLRLLFVCTGNICRSPTAERLAAADGKRSTISDLQVSSAGIRAVTQHPIHPNAATVIEELGGDASDFAARQLTRRIALEADLILTMTIMQRNAVLQLAPQRLHRTFTLIEASRLVSECRATRIGELSKLRPRLKSADSKQTEVPDPIRRDLEFFRLVGYQIASHLPPILDLCRQDEEGVLRSSDPTM